MDKEIQELNREKIKAKSAKNYKELAGICNYLGKCLAKKQRFEEAIEEHKEELELCVSFDDQLGEGIARRAIGECHSEIGRYGDALKQQQKYLELVRSLGDKLETQRAFATIGRTYLLNAQESQSDNEQLLTKAEHCFNEAFQLCLELKEELSERDFEEMRSRLYLNFGLVFDQSGNIDKCTENFQRAIYLNKKYGFKEDLQRCHLSLAAFYEKKAQYETSSRVYDDAIAVSKQLKNKIYICDALIGKGLVMMHLEDFESAKRYFRKAYKCKSSVEADHLKAERYTKIMSVICEDILRLSKAETLDDKVELCDKLGDHFIAMNSYKLALKYYNKQLDFASNCGKSDAEMSKIYISLAQTYLDDRNLNEALYYFNQELECYRDDCIDKCKTLLQIAYIKEKMNCDDEDIVNIYESMLNILVESDNQLLVQVLKSYEQFLVNAKINGTRLDEIKKQLQDIGDTNEDDDEENDEEEESEEIDSYDRLDINDFSDLSSNSESEEETGIKISRTRRKKTQLKLNEVGETRLHRACIEGKLKIAQKLLETGHPINVRDYCGWTPLHEAVNHGFIDIVKLLIESGANINDTGGSKCDGITPLHDACSAGQISVARLLIECGADITLLTSHNETPLDCLRSWKNRCDSDHLLNDNDREDFYLLEHKLENAMNDMRFLKQASHMSSNMSPFSQNSLVIDDSPVKSNTSETSCDTSPLKNHTFGDDYVDIDKPGAACRDYRTTISNLRRQKDPNTELYPNRNVIKIKRTKIPSMINEGDVVQDDWLIDDCRPAKKRSVRDLYDSFGPTKSNSEESLRKSTKIHKTNQSNGNDCEIIDENITEYSDNNDDINDSSKESSIPTNNTSEITSVSVYNIRVIIEDSTIIIPIPSKTTVCSWLKKEVTKRYFAVSGIKANITLETTDNAILGENDCVLNVATDNKVMAKIVSYITDTPLNIYREMCEANDLEVLPEILAELENVNGSCKLELSDCDLPSHQIKPIFLSLQRNTALKEIDISCTNIISDDIKSFLICLSSLQSLATLNLKCTSIDSVDLEELISKCNASLVELNLSFNPIGDYCADIVMKLLNKYDKLSTIDFSGCDFSNDFLEKIDSDDLFKSSNIKSIIFDYNTIDDEFVEKYKSLRIT